ncbi:TlpA disulfide reductase family protein [Spongiimicrobium sp. 3-5]|uniref:TlpA disulfide reductase family protein n=1 Tax=Spongiimicrobium sp. 3-5 TaxID=3332596 RepID=UPI0039814E30
MVRIALLFLVLLVFSGCSESKKELPKAGMWLAELQVSDDEVLPFNFKLIKSGEADFKMEVYNAEEVITIENINLKNDSVIIKMPVYEGYLAGVFTEERIAGDFIKESLDRVVPFTATYGDLDRFTSTAPASVDVSGIWEATFNLRGTKPYIAKGIFDQKGDRVTGTFRTTTGDYRYLEGRIIGDSLKISTFDGAHAFLFTAKVTDSTLNGIFYSGNHSKEIFESKRNTNFELPDEESLTYLKEGYDTLEFSFPDENGTMISLQDEQFKNKVVLLQIMGTWCPNCLDETRFLTSYLQENHHKDLQVMALAFEYAKTKEAAFAGIQRLKDRIGVTYPVVLAQYGTSNKVKAQEKLPMLNHVLSYPTTIFIDKKGVVRKIHTGFNGPATGAKYTAFKTMFHDFLTMLLEE